MNGKKIGLIIDENYWFKPFFNSLDHEFKNIKWICSPSKFPRPKTIKDLFWILKDRTINRWRIFWILARSDVTFFEWATRLLVIGTNMKKRSKIIVRLHRFEVFEFGEKIDWEKVDKIIFVCEAMRNRFLKMFPNYQNDTEVIHNFLDVTKFRPMNRTTNFKIGILGDISVRKRVYDLVLSFYELHKKIPNLELHIAGTEFDKEYSIFVKELISKLGLENNVLIDGYIKNIVKWYNEIDIIISNSYHESTHITLFEGAACGCYPLSHFWDGIEEFLPKENIFSTESDLIKKICNYYSLNELERRNKSKEMRALMLKRYKNKNQVKKMIKSINEL